MLKFSTERDESIMPIGYLSYIPGFYFGMHRLWDVYFTQLWMELYCTSGLYAIVMMAGCLRAKVSRCGRVSSGERRAEGGEYGIWNVDSRSGFETSTLYLRF